MRQVLESRIVSSQLRYPDTATLDEPKQLLALALSFWSELESYLSRLLYANTAASHGLGLAVAVSRASSTSLPCSTS